MNSFASNPKHIGLIPDGTRRWAKKNNLNYFDAYLITMQGIARFVNYMFDEGVEAISVYLLSKENLERPQADLESVFLTEEELIKNFLPPIVARFRARVIHAGKTNFLPKSYSDAIASLIKISAGYQERRLYLLAAYNSLDELEEIYKTIEKPPITIATLWVPEPLDLVIRTSGEYRLSNFLPLQSAYAEILFTEKHFNELSMNDLVEFLNAYQKRQRRFGL